jgi:hypothetical protein
MNQQRKYVAYLLRMWQEGGKPPLWRASLEMQHSHEVPRFFGLGELVAFLREQTHIAPLKPGAPAAGGILSERR